MGWFLAASVALGIVVLDQMTKWCVRSDMLVGERRNGIAFLDLVRVSNKGVAFGALGNYGWLVPLLTVAATAAILVWFAKHASDSWAWLPAGLVLGGAIGNFWDRIQRGEVTDFLKLPHWPAFNVADIAITAGVILLVITAEVNSRNRGSRSN
jgi:signal peptidase II